MLINRNNNCYTNNHVTSQQLFDSMKNPEALKDLNDNFVIYNT